MGHLTGTLRQNGPSDLAKSSQAANRAQGPTQLMGFTQELGLIMAFTLRPIAPAARKWTSRKGVDVNGPAKEVTNRLGN